MSDVFQEQCGNKILFEKNTNECLRCNMETWTNLYWVWEFMCSAVCQVLYLYALLPFNAHHCPHFKDGQN